MKKWAWGTGSAERYPPGEQHEAWRRHIANDKAAYHRRDDLLRVMAIAPRMDAIYVGEVEERVTPAAFVARHEPEALKDGQ